MKKLVLIVAMLGFVLFLGACGNQNIGVGGNESISVQREKLEAINTWLRDEIPQNIFEDISLPSTHPELGGTIVWEFFDDDVLFEGYIMTQATVAEANLGYTIKYGTVTKTDLLTVNVLNATFGDVATLFRKQFANTIDRNYNVQTSFYNGLYTVTWTSSNEEVFDHDGVLHRPIEETNVVIDYTVHLDDETKDYSIELRVAAMSVSEKLTEIKDWIKTNYLPYRLVEEEITLPTSYDKYNASIEWYSSNYNVIDNEGNITRYAFDRYVTLNARVRMGIGYTDLDFSLVIAKKEFTSQEEEINSFLEAIGVEELPRVTFQYYSNINQSYNFISFFDALQTPIVDKTHENNNTNTRSYTNMTKVEFITIHDTANNNPGAGALMHANYLKNGAGGRTVSWHFAVDQYGAHQSVPIPEVSWHAGDGARVFKLNKTNILATTKYPELGISKNGYYTFNGIESHIKAPLAGSRIATTADIAPAGIYTEVGEDGYYYINNTHWDSTYNRIGQDGGNRNAISFETCVDSGSDYFLTFRHVANITADLLIEYNLSVDRITQHNNFSGKECPLTIMRTNYWNNYLDLVSLIKYGKENFANYDFEWTSYSSELLSNGQIVRSAKSGTSLEYSVIVTSKSDPLDTYAKDFITVLK